MFSKHNSCALVTRFADARVAESATLLAGHLNARGVTVLVPGEEIEQFAGARVTGIPEQELAGRADLVVSIGGDGTLLFAAGLVATCGTPLLGINRGRLGFLTDVMPEEMIASVEAAIAGDCERDERHLLAAELHGTAEPGMAAAAPTTGLALNDVVMQKSLSGHLLDFETSINGRFVNSHGGDGLIVASATGSTAYALSCGGPIIEPQLDAVVVAPICPHTLSDRPIVVSRQSQIEVRLIERPDSRAEVSYDGRQLGTLVPGGRLVVGPSAHRIVLLHPAGYDYFRLLRSKLNWGRRSFEVPR
jgi:NAD+ kinase